MKVIITTIMALCFSIIILNAQDQYLIHQYLFDGNLEDAVGDSNGIYVGGNATEPVYIEGHDGTANGAIDFNVTAGKGYMIYVGTYSPVQEGEDGEITITFWALWHGSTESYQDIINKRTNYEPEEMMWGINQHLSTDHHLSFRRRGFMADSKEGIPEGVWTHVAISCDGEKAYFYMNGVRYDEVVYEYGTGYNARIHMGSAGNGDGTWREGDAYNGALDDVRFYSAKLLDHEIRAIYEGASGIEDKSSPDQFELVHNYPNPFISSTQIDYKLKQSTNVELSIYNIHGQNVATLVNQYQEAGSYNVTWDASKATPGVYFYTIKADNFAVSKRMTLVK